MDHSDKEEDKGSGERVLGRKRSEKKNKGRESHKKREDIGTLIGYQGQRWKKQRRKRERERIRRV